MNRCRKPFAASFFALLVALAMPWVAASALLLTGTPAQAQVKRTFPFKSERGNIEFTPNTRQVLINQQVERLAPGVRVLDEGNRLVWVSKLQGQTIHAQYRRGPGGLIQEIWILNKAELAETQRRAAQRGQLAPMAGDAGYLN